LIALLAVGLAAAAGAEPVQFNGTLSLRLNGLPGPDILGSGTAIGSITGGAHLASLTMPASIFGPITTSVSIPGDPVTVTRIEFTGVNLAGSFPTISGGPSGGGTMGLSGIAKMCLVFDPTCLYVNVPIPMTPTTGGAGFGIGGTVVQSGAVQVTLQHAPWTVGQPTLTIHNPATAVTTPVLPGGFAHGAASATSSTAGAGGVLQLVTATKAYTSLTGAFPEMPVTGILRLEIQGQVCADNLDNDNDGLTDHPDDPGCDSPADDSERSPALVCDNGLDDDGDGVIDSQDPGCDDPEDPSEQSAALACDNGLDDDADTLIDTLDPGCDDPADVSEQSAALLCDDGLDNDGDGKVDGADAGCDDGLDPFEENCGHVIQFTDNTTEDAAPDVSDSQVVWQQWDGTDFEVLRSDGASVTPLTSNALLDLTPAIEGPDVAWQEWGGGDARILVDQGGAPIPLTGAGVSGWEPDVDDSGVVWSQGPSLFLPADAVYYWNGTTTTDIFGSVGGESPALEDGSVAWETAAGIHLWTGSTTVLIPGSAGGHEPSVWGNRVVWHASDGNDDEIFLWNGSTTQQLTDNATDDRNADISGSRVTWESADGVQVWKNGTTSLVTGSAGAQQPRIDGLDVVWQASDGSDNEIYLVTVCAACNDGADNEGDGKIDYDGGLSALGYIAADPDPQCGGNPWKDKETSGPCGLGFELAFLLPGLMWLRRRRGVDRRI
jgi:hypothetical protein